jgi:hypothetical protein
MPFLDTEPAEGQVPVSQLKQGSWEQERALYLHPGPGVNCCSV